MTQKYSYVISTDMGGSVNLATLFDEIGAAGLATALEDVNKILDDLHIEFASILSQADKTTLDGGLGQAEEHPPLAGSILANHDSTPSVASIASIPTWTTKSLGESNRTNTNWFEKVSLSVTADEDGYWLVWWSGEVRVTDSAARVEARVQQDDTDDLMLSDWHPDSVGNVGWGPFGMQAHRFLSKGVHTFDVDFRTSTSGKQVSMRNVRISALKATLA
jgi:hypothetical protein